MSETHFSSLDRAIKTLTAQRARLESTDLRHPSIASIAQELRIAASELMVMAISLQSHQRIAVPPLEA
ncbi:hypothetical protein VAPA_1c32710 [Variovorax paradoxus B4]|uniref:Uncharacterized protein n=1 Tax=Variovorax paradoxus B4 TaxID=1246301 RepID=T1XBP5_VARPD|nr:hypothetical protein [Variovorax paradoxus]AGU50357.1 hypothetical protein VAPA_1c32710 [Variovorax paradoxus B4]